MCQDWLGKDFQNVREFLAEVKERAQARRKRDGPVRYSNFTGGEPGSAAAPEKRAAAALCYAYNVKDGEFYVGYSGYPGGMTYRVPKTTREEYRFVTLENRTDQSQRRQERLMYELDGVGS